MNDNTLLNGDKAYAPLEMLPQFTFLRPVEWLDMNLATDSYELGYLMTFYFSDLNMPGMLIERLNKIEFVEVYQHGDEGLLGCLL